VTREPTALPRLYAILDAEVCAARGLTPALLLATWLDAGIELIQLRAKSVTFGPLLELAEASVRACQGYGARLIINDRADVAMLSAAGGVHVGQDDLSPRDVRAVTGSSTWVGLSTHTAAQVERAVEEPVTYVAIGPVYPTMSKQRPDETVGVSGVTRAAGLAHRRGLPLVAIGGISIETANDVLGAGADSVAVISGLIDDAPAALAAQWVRLLQ
jgi:thiamine-phosphate pyrophosphorylase